MTTRTETSRGLLVPIEASTKGAEVRRLYDHAPIGIAATFINSLILIGILRNLVEPRVLFMWWACLMVVTGARFAQVEWFRRVVSEDAFDARRWGAYFVGGLGAAGTVWGAASIWLLPASVAHQTFVAFVLGGMVAGAAATFSVRMDAFLAYAVPALTPLAGRFFLIGDELHVAMGAMVLLFGLLLTGTAHRVNRLLARTILLASNLSEASKQSHELNARLLSSERACSEAEEALATRSDEGDERLQQYVADMTETFVTLQEKNERRLLQRFERDRERARLDAAASFGAGMAYRLDDIFRKLADQVREGLRHPDVFDSAMTRQALRSIEGVVDEEVSLVNELLVFSGRGPIESKRIDVGELVESIASEWRMRLPPNVELWHSSAKEMPRVEGSSRALAHALGQLLSNAADAMDDERGTIEIRIGVVTRGEVEFTDATPSESKACSFVAIEVLDDGSGMGVQTSQRALEPFFSTRSRGRGLGLTVVNAVARRHQGTLTLETVQPVRAVLQPVRVRSRRQPDGVV